MKASRWCAGAGALVLASVAAWAQPVPNGPVSPAPPTAPAQWQGWQGQEGGRPAPSPPPASDGVVTPAAQEYVVVPEAFPWKQLLGKGKGKEFYGVVVMPTQGLLTPTAEAALARKVQDTLKKHPNVRAADLHPNPASLQELPDSDAAKRAGNDLDVDRVVVVRTYPAAEAGGPPRLVLSLLTSDGDAVQSVSTLNVLVPAQQGVAKGVKRILNDDGKPARDEEPRPKREARKHPVDDAARDEAVKEFKAKALTLGKEDRQGNRSIYRGGRELTDQEMDALGVPDAAAAETHANPLLAILYGLLTPLVLLCPFAGLGCGVVACSAFGAGYGAIFSTGNVIDASVSGGAVCLVFCGMPLGVFLGLIGLLGGGGATGVGIWGLIQEFNPSGGDRVHPYVDFVTEHNRDLARSLGLRTRDLGRKYFPAG